MITGTTGLDHVGFSVLDLDRSITFYSLLLEREPIMRRRYPEQYVARVVGYDEIDMDVAFFRDWRQRCCPGAARIPAATLRSRRYGNLQRRQRASMSDRGRSTG